MIGNVLYLSRAVESDFEKSKSDAQLTIFRYYLIFSDSIVENEIAPSTFLQRHLSEGTMPHNLRSSDFYPEIKYLRSYIISY